MADTSTKRGRLLQIEQYTKPSSWGPELNEGALQRADDMWGVTEVTVNANVTLTIQNFIADQSRGFVLILSGAGGYTVTAPAIDKPYLVVNNCAADVTVKPGASGTGVVVRAGTAPLYYTNAAGTVGYVSDPTLDKVKAPAANVSLNSRKITNLATPTDAADAVTKAYADTVNATVADDAATAAAAAITATTQAGLAIAAYDSFDDRYLGAKASDPTLDNDGNALQVGAVYWNSTANQLRVWSGTLWTAITLLAFASQAQAEAGTVTGVVMNPLLTAQAIDAQVKVARTVYTSSATFTKEADDLLYFIEAIGAGASGNVNTTAGSKRGGGGGAYASIWLPASLVASSETITVASGGAAVVNPGSNVNGNSGGDSSFGSFLLAKGGSASGASAAGGGEIATGGYSSGAGGAGGNGFDCVMGGAGGGGGNTGTGGTSANGGNGGAAVAAGTAVSGSAPGGGGGATGAINGTSGAGARGEVRVTRFKR